VEEQLKWIGLVRHGESAGNVARDEAESGGLDVIDIAERDADVPLTALGEDQAGAVGRWLAETQPPDVVVASTYRRAYDTARLALDTAGLDQDAVLDERLRDRELGVLDLLTARGSASKFPDEQIRRRRLGKFYYRPPGGESWADVVLRVRSLLDELHRRHRGGRVLLVAHEMTVFALRYILEGVPEPELLKAAAATTVPNASITAWESTGERYDMVLAQHIDHLHREGAEATVEHEPGSPSA
jgi:broad specificity phosphatase PhoE